MVLIEDLVGTFNLIGSNQNADNNTYKGTLTLALDENKRINAHWLINGNQEQHGTGFYKDAILVINFNYLGDDNETYKGVVVYKCLTKDILDGFWSEKHGNPMFLGEEKCFRVKSNSEIN
ncbi:hypothetical protein [Tenacibaculum sp. 190524A02b]|uniref:Uncharacterized protein n=1 Tax=Tenacibaculum vairaonense TaxID=3137860 RepID=A0ABM9PR63_9FLAO